LSVLEAIVESLIHPITTSLVLHVSLVAGLSMRVIMKRPSVGVALAWLLLIFAVPFLGAVLYLLFGEYRVSRRRVGKMRELAQSFRSLTEQVVDPELLSGNLSEYRLIIQGISQIGQTFSGSPAVHGSQLELRSSADDVLKAIRRDIDSATESVLMEFYIWNEGGVADEVLQSLICAAERGVYCLVLIDSLGARPWWKGNQPQQLRNAGVELRAALPVGPLRFLFGRTDLRLHRKIVVVDGAIAWTGSMNMVDPRYFKQDAGAGQWVDAMVRIQGAAVAPLMATMLGDWILEGEEPAQSLINRLPNFQFRKLGTADMHVLRSGPNQNSDALLQMLLGAINAAEFELTLTTPYLVPDESLLQAIRNAAARGVSVQIMLPEKVDSFLTRHACRSYFEDLLSAGVRIHFYRAGLLHTKSIRVDDDLSVFGTANLDVRSLRLNYEVSLFIFDKKFNSELKQLHLEYLAQSVELDPLVWAARPFREQFLQNTLRLVSPLL
jgi:cardiolipin synthase A/B